MNKFLSHFDRANLTKSNLNDQEKIDIDQNEVALEQTRTWTWTPLRTDRIHEVLTHVLTVHWVLLLSRSNKYCHLASTCSALNLNLKPTIISVPGLKSRL